MIAGVLSRHSRQYPDRTFLSTATGRRSYAECAAEVDRLASELEASRGLYCAVEGRPDADTILRIFALDRIGARVALLPPGEDPTQVPGLGQSADPGEVVLFTSGTTARPKAALHTWSSLLGRVHRSDALDASRWLLTYSLSAFAGIQVFLHALQNAGQITLGPPDPASLLDLALGDGVTHISGTPTFFRLLLTRSRPEDLHRLVLRQITLGGEAVDQLLLDRLRTTFAGAQITHIYASTEAGACFSVHDGREGFPASYLDSTAAPVRLSIVDGELFVDSPHAMRGYLGPEGARRAPGPLATGDLVEVRGDRVFFLGRRSERINVGGNKVHPEEIERRILEVPGVRAARVSGTASSLVGQIVRADVVIDPGMEQEPMRRRILDHCRSGLAPWKLPRLLSFVEGLDCTVSGKVRRGEAR